LTGLCQDADSMALKYQSGIAILARLQTYLPLMENTIDLGEINHLLKNANSAVAGIQDSSAKIEHLTHGWIQVSAPSM
jgi:hypothetical protein